MTTALDPSASPHCVFGADGGFRCAAQEAATGNARGGAAVAMWGPPRVATENARGAAARAQREAERQQAVQHRQWLWQQQQGVVAAQQRPQ